MTSLPHANGPIRGEVVVPGSKSETNRALVLAALGDGPSRITGALVSRDSELMIGALKTLGLEIIEEDEALVVAPSDFVGGGTIDCGLAGTVMRFVPPLSMLADSPVEFVGDPHASERPMDGLLDGLRQLGAGVEGDRLPFTVTPGEFRTSEVVIDSSGSSQFVSGLALVGNRVPGGLVIRHEGATVPSRPHIEMTLAMLRERGIEAQEIEHCVWEIPEGTLRALDSQVEPDLTNASVFLAAALVAGGEVIVPAWPEETTQPGAMFIDVARRFGGDVEALEGKAVAKGGSTLRGVDVDLGDASELTPVVAALGAVAEGTTTIRGVAHIRGHETDRLHALVTELRRAGLAAEELEDGLAVTGGEPSAAEFETYADHRMVHFAALLGLLADGSTVTDMECVSKTMPGFPTMWAGLL